ncbi:peroxisomal membrane protein PEX16 [Strongylocentrotus purpuratus]|uniref:Peroxisomal membrane protein PEX16 n=1 Tax=Strongylocentrotus purpuratus TaxID=7668 RepID=A0A7M7P572_STRPU|nr:peroxisomal membrane protein PEX16 [Strongylocentrotus purpuratus]
MSSSPLTTQEQACISMKFLSKMSLRYQETCAWYRKWVVENPDVVSQVEKTFRVLSYCITGFTDNGQILSEFVYALSNLLVFFNDSILRRASASLSPKISLSQDRLRRWLTILDHVEVFFELASKQVWGETGKWIVIAAIQLLRTIFRLVLLCRLKSGIQSSPPIPNLNRKNLPPVQREPSADAEVDGDLTMAPFPLGPDQPQSLTFEGRRSGRVVRSLHATPDIGLRTWKLPQTEQPSRIEEDLGMTELAGISLMGETLYISRPLIHLSSLFVWGWSSWKPWLLSIAADTISLKMMQRDEKSKLNSKEKSELHNRKMMLLFYLLRSPCYNTVTRTRLKSLLQSVGGTVPGARLLTKPILEYLPVWQKIYSYNWGN